MRKKIYSNKHGWVRIIEAFVAILIIAGVVLVLIGNENIGMDDNSEGIYTIQGGILREIQNNDTLRGEIFLAEVPINSSESDFPEMTNDTINSRVPSFLICASKICALDSECLYGNKIYQNIYTKSIIISTNQTDFGPRKFSLFCFRK